MGVAWNGNNIGGATKRAVGIAMHVGFGNLGGVIAGFSFRTKDAPRYFSGLGMLIGMVTMSLCFSIFMHIYLIRENARRDAKPKSDLGQEAERELGDNASVSGSVICIERSKWILTLVFSLAVFPIYSLIDVRLNLWHSLFLPFFILLGTLNQTETFLFSLFNLLRALTPCTYHSLYKRPMFMCVIMKIK